MAARAVHGLVNRVYRGAAKAGRVHRFGDGAVRHTEGKSLLDLPKVRPHVAVQRLAIYPGRQSEDVRSGIRFHGGVNEPLI